MPRSLWVNSTPGEAATVVSPDAWRMVQDTLPAVDGVRTTQTLLDGARRRPGHDQAERAEDRARRVRPCRSSVVTASRAASSSLAYAVSRAGEATRFAAGQVGRSGFRRGGGSGRPRCVGERTLSGRADPPA